MRKAHGIVRVQQLQRVFQRLARLRVGLHQQVTRRRLPPVVTGEEALKDFVVAGIGELAHAHVVHAKVAAAAPDAEADAGRKPRPGHGHRVGVRRQAAGRFRRRQHQPEGADAVAQHGGLLEILARRGLLHAPLPVADQRRVLALQERFGVGRLPRVFLPRH